MSPPAPRVYLDNHATTRVDPRVVAALLPYLTELYGNAGGAGHPFGWEAADALERAREQVAALVGAVPREVVFTSGATESNNLALRGVLPALRQKRDHLVTAAAEHAAVLGPLRRLAREGWKLTVLRPRADGTVNPDAVAEALTDRTALVSVMAANNEVGALNDLPAIARACHARGALFHTDASQAAGKVPLDLHESGADLASFTAHKLYGPKGIGALWVNRRDAPPRLSPLAEGGGQEYGLRPGTVPVPLAVGFGEACALARLERVEEAARLLDLRARLWEKLVASGTDPRLNGPPSNRLPGNLNVSFEGVEGEALRAGLARTGLAVSSGAACSSANPEPSHVLLAMGLDEALARASLRFGLGRFNTPADVDFAADAVARVLDRLRARPVGFRHAAAPGN